MGRKDKQSPVDDIGGSLNLLEEFKNIRLISI